MEYATLGDTDLLVSKLCFGTMTFGDGRGFYKANSAVGQSGADELVKTSIDGGINFFDTADMSPCTSLARMALGKACGNLGHHRRETPRTARGQSRGSRTHTHVSERNGNGCQTVV